MTIGSLTDSFLASHPGAGVISAGADFDNSVSGCQRRNGLAVSREPLDQEGSPMHPVVFTLQFRGSAAPVPGTQGKVSAKTARSQVHRTTLEKTGVQSRVEAGSGNPGRFESEVQMTGAGTFVESGRITYGRAAALTFRTVGQGLIGASGIEGYQRGAVIWEVTGGEGRFTGATGLITSNFSVGSEGRGRRYACHPPRSPGRGPTRGASRPEEAHRSAEVGEAPRPGQRQWLRVHQPRPVCLVPARGGDLHPQSSLPEKRQRPRRAEERRHRPSAHRL